MYMNVYINIYIYFCEYLQEQSGQVRFKLPESLNL